MWTDQPKSIDFITGNLDMLEQSPFYKTDFERLIKSIQYATYPGKFINLGGKSIKGKLVFDFILHIQYTFPHFS